MWTSETKKAVRFQTGRLRESTRGSGVAENAADLEGEQWVYICSAMQVIPGQIRRVAAITTSTKRFLILQATACACIGSVLAQGFAGELHRIIVKILSYHLSGRIGRTSLALRQQSPRIHTTAF